MRRELYPPDWEAISLRIRALSGGRCECRGQCGTEHVGSIDTDAAADRGRCPQLNGQPLRGRKRTVLGTLISRVVLTVAHLDHGKDDNSDANLCAMCQACHLRYDADQHRRNAALTRHMRRIATGQQGIWEQS